MTTDIVVVGGGIVGLAVARSLTEAYPHLTLKVLQRDSDWSLHSTGAACGVIHSGIGYLPGTLKARLACAGNERLVRFCKDHNIRHDICGKVIVATEPEELPVLQALAERAQALKIPIRRLSAAELREREPHTQGLAALLVRSSGIVDYAQVAEKLSSLLAADGVELQMGTRVETIERSQGEIHLGTSRGVLKAAFLINCLNLGGERAASMEASEAPSQRPLCHGDFFRLKPDRSHLVRHLVYPVPDARFPYLGVHLVRSIQGGVDVGPNAVLSFRQPADPKTSFNFSEAKEVIRSLAKRSSSDAALNARMRGMEPASGFNLTAFTQRLRRLVPDLTADDLVPTAEDVPIGAMNLAGEWMEDLQMVTGRDSIHVCNVDAPSASVSLELGRYIAQQAAQAVAFPGEPRSDESWLVEPQEPYCEGICEI